MILTGPEIRREVRAGRIHIDDFDPDRVEPNSYGFRLARNILWYEQEVIDCREPGRTGSHHIGPEGYVLQPGRFYLWQTITDSNNQPVSGYLSGTDIGIDSEIVNSVDVQDPLPFSTKINKVRRAAEWNSTSTARVHKVAA